MKLPEMLLGGSLKGVKLQSEIFLEPGDVPAFSGLPKSERAARCREERFQQALLALGRLMHWARAERYAFMSSLMGITPPTSKRVEQGVGEDLPKMEDADAAGVRAVGNSSDESVEDQADEVEIRSFVRPPRPADGGKRPANDGLSSAPSSLAAGCHRGDHIVDLITEGILPAASVADAAFELELECEKLHGVPMSLAKSDTASVLTACVGNIGVPAADAGDTSSSGDSNCSSDLDGHAFDISSHPVVDGSVGHSSAETKETSKPNSHTEEEIQRLGNAYMANKAGGEPSSESKEAKRTAFLAMERHTWIISRGKNWKCYLLAVGALQAIVEHSLQRANARARTFYHAGGGPV